MRRFGIFFAAIFFALAVSREANAQWLDGKLAIRTNGNNFQSGDQLKVELLALDLVNEHFYTQVFYGYSETVKEADKDGKVTEQQVEKKMNRQSGPVLVGLKQFQMITLDDSFFFGDTSPTGRYTIEVGIFQAYTDRLLLKLRSCVFFQSVAEEQACGAFLRALKSVQTEMLITFDGRFNSEARYSVTFLNKNKVVRHIISGAFTNGARTLLLSSDMLSGLTEQTFDILLLDHNSGVSSTLSRVTIASVK